MRASTAWSLGSPPAGSGRAAQPCRKQERDQIGHGGVQGGVQCWGTLTQQREYVFEDRHHIISVAQIEQWLFAHIQSLGAGARLLAVGAQPVKRPGRAGVGPMGVRGAAIDPGQLAGRDGKGFSARVHKAAAAHAQEQVMAGIGEPFDRIVRRGLKMAGPQHGMKQTLTQAAGGVEMRSVDARHDDSIIQIGGNDSAWNQ
jgi:hypothetical protein